jgi:DNA-binding CsgD family transcriptional regulator
MAGFSCDEMVALRGGSSKHTLLYRRLADALPAVLRRRTRSRTTLKRQVQRRLTPEQVEQLVIEYQSGKSMQELARSWHLHRTTVVEHLRRAGVSIRQRGIPPESLDESIGLYMAGWPCRRLAERYHCDDETVRQTLKRVGIKLRAPWEREGHE